MKAVNQEYLKCTTAEKLECNKKRREAMLATIFMMKADKGRYSKLLTDLHDDHLKGYSCYPNNLADAQKLLLNYSGSNKQKNREKRDDNNDVSDLAFVQEGSGGGYTFTGKCFNRIPVMVPLTAPLLWSLFKGPYFPQKLTPKSSIETEYKLFQKYVPSY
jgi:hypothetical protein